MPFPFLFLFFRHFQQHAGLGRCPRRRLRCSLLAVWALVGSSLEADPTTGTIFVCDASDDRVLALRDLDASGTIEPGVDGEITVYYGEVTTGPPLSTPSHLATDGSGALYLLDGGTLDAVLVLRDLDGDGTAEGSGEYAVFYSGDEGAVALATPNTLVRGPDGAFYITDDGSGARRVLRLEDTNNDGDALDVGEVSIVLDDTALSSAVPADIESLAFLNDGVAVVGDSSTGMIWKLTDLNGDRDFLDAGEVAIFYDGSGPVALNDVDCLAVVEDEVYACDEDVGLLVRFRDVDSNGTISGAGEVTVVVDASVDEPVSDTNDFLPLDDGSFLLLDGAADAIFRAFDANGDGDALDLGEVVRWLADSGETLGTPSGIVCVVPPGSGELKKFLRGDAARDGQLDIADPLAILGFLFLGEATAACLDALDANDDGDVNISDPVYLLNFLFLGAPPPPSPYPTSGTDPTIDPLECDTP